jgi:MoaA/NifB/PqqE/SkfB family radical SAM enzyme
MSKYGVWELEKIVKTIKYRPQAFLLELIIGDRDLGDKVTKDEFSVYGDLYMLIDSSRAKLVIGPEYNYLFVKKTGFFQRWGKTIDDDPLFSPLGPEILDIEISVNGCPPIGDGGNCKFCYKSKRNAEPTNMSLVDFKTIIDKIPKALTQVAFGITGIQTNPDFIPMMKYCREIGIVPNFTLSGADLTDEIAKEVSGVAGALAASAYESDKNICYDTVKTFTDLGMNQVNIHIMISDETIDFVYEVLEDRLTDDRLSMMNAIVFLGVKPKGRAAGKFHSLSKSNYQKLVEFCMNKNISFGFDSCSSPKFESAVKEMDVPNISKLIESSESCESDLMSSYINVNGEYWHCSFTEGEPNQTCVNALGIDDFLCDVWYSRAVANFRTKLLTGAIGGCRLCPVFPEINN